MTTPAEVAAAPSPVLDNAQAADQALASKMYPNDQGAPAAPSAPVVPAESTPAVEGSQDSTKPEGEQQKAEAAKVEGEAPKEGEKDAPPEAVKAVEKYELKLPEESILPAEHLAGIEEFAKANSLTQDAAQAMVDRESSLLANFVEAQKQAAEQQAQAWHQQVSEDKIMGGDNFKATAFYAEKGLSIHGNPELGQILAETGFGNHPAVVKHFARLGRASAPDSFEKQGALPVEKKSMEERWYGPSGSQSEG